MWVWLVVEVGVEVGVVEMDDACCRSGHGINNLFSRDLAYIKVTFHFYQLIGPN